jgi:hypothetical protein
MKQDNNKEPINKEAFKMLAVEIGLNEAARRLGVPIPTAKSWAQRGKWNLPRRKGGGRPKAYPVSSQHPVANTLNAFRGGDVGFIGWLGFFMGGSETAA